MATLIFQFFGTVVALASVPTQLVMIWFFGRIVRFRKPGVPITGPSFWSVRPINFVWSPAELTESGLEARQNCLIALAIYVVIAINAAFLETIPKVVL